MGFLEIVVILVGIFWSFASSVEDDNTVFQNSSLAVLIGVSLIYLLLRWVGV